MDEELRNRIVIVAIIFVILLGIASLFIPINGSMKIETIGWQWSVDVKCYTSKGKELRSDNKGRVYGSKKDAERDMDNVREKYLPSDAYDIRASVKSKEERKSIGTDSDGNTIYMYYTVYYILYNYRVNVWDSFNQICASGTDTDCHEPERPYPIYTDISDPQVGDKGCAKGHHEKYTVSGIADREVKTFDISRSDWEAIHEKGASEIWFKRHKLTSDIYDVRFESEE